MDFGWYPDAYAISIHLMFLLIFEEVEGYIKERHFNTSHVSINQRSLFPADRTGTDFNTSHVSINRGRKQLRESDIRISIHLMFLLIQASLCSRSPIFVISIHLMFLLIGYLKPAAHGTY